MADINLSRLANLSVTWKGHLKTIFFQYHR